MPGMMPRSRRAARPNRWAAAFLICLAWLVVVALAVRKLRQAEGILVASAGFAAVALTCAIGAWADRARWQAPIQEMTDSVRFARKGGAVRPSSEFPPELAPLAHE